MLAGYGSLQIFLWRRKSPPDLKAKTNGQCIVDSSLRAADHLRTEIRTATMTITIFILFLALTTPAVYLRLSQ